ncbi:MAG: HPP family protein, partial [Actinobacteria bacterium]|nr:HPP family protein [Actinomycetota bacterium]
QVTRSFPPPGAATAALAVMGLANYQTSSIHFVIFPVLAGAVILVAITRALRVALSPTLRETSPLVKDVQASVSAQLSPRQKEASWGNK